MRDWSKFAWKKGDILQISHIGFCTFEEWASDNYTTFKGRYGVDLGKNNNHDYDVNEDLTTSMWNKVDNKDFIKEYLSTVEERFGGKLNLSTLEIEKPQLKDGDIVFYEDSEHEEVCSSIFIFRGKQNHTPRFLYHAILDSDGFFNAKEGAFGIYEGTLRLATDSEKRQLFDALAKERKRWNSETKTLENLSKKFKALDYILIKDIFRTWQLHQYAFDNKHSIITVGGDTYSKQCKILPYNDQTAHLLGTTDDWKGGNND